MKHIISAIMLMVFILGFFAFMFLSIDIVDGRNMELKQSPYFEADTTNAALSIGIFFMLISLAATFIILYIYKCNKQIA